MELEDTNWGREECARLCELILSENTGIAQQIVENRHDLLDLMTVEQLSTPDDIGLTAQFLAVYYDKPDAVHYLYTRGVDFTAICDPMQFGTPMYYAVAFSRYNMIRTLESVGVNVSSPCDCLGYQPLFHAERIDDKSVKQLISRLLDKKGRAIQMVRKNLMKRRATKLYAIYRQAIRNIQRIIRGFLGRRRFQRKLMKVKLRQQFGDMDDDDSTVVSATGESVDEVKSHHSHHSGGSKGSKSNGSVDEVKSYHSHHSGGSKGSKSKAKIKAKVKENLHEDGEDGNEADEGGGGGEQDSEKAAESGDEVAFDELNEEDEEDDESNA